MTITSRPATGDTYSLGETIEVAVRFSQVVGIRGTPQLALSIGSSTRQADYNRTTSATHYFRYVVQQADMDNNGLSIGTSALTLNSGTIRSNQGSDAVLGLGSHAITNAANAKVNGAANSPAVVTGVSITSRPARGNTFILGEEIRVQVTFNKAVTVEAMFTAPLNNGFPFLNLTIGSSTRRAVNKGPAESHPDPPSTTHTFRYTVQVGDYDSDGLGIAANALDLNGRLGAISNNGVNANINLGSHAISASAYKVDGRRASVSRVSITSSPSADNTYAAGEHISVGITFNLPIRITTGSTVPKLDLAVGSQTRQMDYNGFSANGISFRYTVQASDRDADGVSFGASALKLNGAVIETAANGNRAVTTISGVQGGTSHKVDGSIRPPVVRYLSMNSPQRGSTFDEHEEIKITVGFTQSVTVTGTPRLTLVIGSSWKALDMRSRSGSGTTLNFYYTVQAADLDLNGFDVPANLLSLNGGTIRNQHGVDAALGHRSIRSYSQGYNTYNVDGRTNHPPVVTRAYFVGRPAGGVYGKSETIVVNINWGKAVTTTGTPQLAIDVGIRTRQAARQQIGSVRQSYHRFHYTVQAVDLDTDGISVGSGALTLPAGTTITGPGGTTASLTLPAIGRDANRRVDGRVLPQPTFSETVPVLTGIVGYSFSRSLPAATGARGTISYAILQALPAGLSFTAASRTISGTPTTVTARATYTLEATDSATNAKGTRAFTIEITPSAAPVFVPNTFDAQVYVKDELLTPVALPAATGGNVPLSYALTGPGTATTLTLPAGVSYTTQPTGTTGGTLSGTPTAVAAQATYTLTATDRDNDEATLTFTIEVQEDAQPTFGTATVANQSWKKNKAITAITLPTATGGNGTLSYALSPALPAGVAKDASHEISGTPSVTLAATTYTWTATDVDGDSAELTFTITVADNSLPAFTGLAPKNRVWTRYKSAGATLPPAFGGDAPLTYTLSPALPAGMTRAASPGDEPGGPPVDTYNRVLTGTPTVEMARTSYAWTVTDVDGDQAVWDFTITVLDNARPDFGTATIADKSWTRRKAITAFMLPTATGGDGSVSYSISPAWPAGVTKDTNHQVSGTPTTAQALTSYTWTATDGDGDKASLTFTITVVDRPLTTLVLSPSTIDEHDGTNPGSATVTATLNKAASTATTVTVSATAGTNAEASDFTLSANKTLTIAAGATTSTGTVTITAVNNADVEPDKSIIVSGSVGNDGVAAPDDVTLTIDDDDGAKATLVLTPLTISESGTGNATTVTATLNKAVSAATMVTVSATAGTNAEASDFTLSANKTLTIAAGATTSTGTVTITAVDNADVEPDKSVTVSGTVGNADVIAPAAVTLTITDDDRATATLVLTPATISESGTGNATTVTATLDQAASAATTVTVSATAGTNAEASDFTLSGTTTLTIAAGATTSTGTVTITAVNNADAEPDKSITVSGTVGNTDVVAPAAVTLTITDDDRVPSRLVLSSSTIAEHDGTNAGSATVTATLGQAVSAATTVTVSATAGTNAEASDFTLSANKTLTIAAGATTSTGTVTITAVNNADMELDKSVTVSGTVGNIEVSAPADVTLTITDDDRPLTPTLFIDSPSVAEGGPGDFNSLDWTVTLIPASSQDVRVGIAVDGTASTAIMGTPRTREQTGADHGFPDGQDLTFVAGQTSKTIGVTVYGDATVEPDETVVMEMSGPYLSAATLGNTIGTGKILNDDTLPAVTLAVGTSAISEDGGTTTVTATLNRVSGAATTVKVAGVAGAYTVAMDSTIVIAAGETSNTSDSVTITAVNDDIDNVGNRSTTVTGTAENTAGVTGAALTLTDDEATPVATLALSEPNASKPDTINESGTGNASTVTAMLNWASSEDVILTVSAAAGANAAASDFTLSGTTTLTIAAGETTSTGTVTITAQDNTKDEPDKSVTVSAVASGNSGVVNPVDATLTIADDDDAPSVSINSPSVAEGASGSTATLTYEVTLSAASGKQVTVAYADASTGTASSADDYTALSSGTLTFAAGETSATIDVTITGDGVDEPDETIIVELSGPNNATLGTASGTGTITDDDDAPSVTLVLSPATIDESGTTTATTVTATLDHASSAATTITVSATGSDFTLSTAKTLTIAAGETTSTGTVTITAVDNDKDEPNKEVTVSGTADNSQGITAPTDETLTITDDDAAPTVTLVLSHETIDESGTTTATTVTATLDHASSAATTITVSAAAGTNAGSGDFALSTAKTLTIAAGETTSTGTVTITAVDNDKDEPNKEVTVSGTADNSQGITAPSDETLTIADDEDTPTVSLFLSPATISENGGVATVTATLDHASSAATTITVSAASGGFTLSANKTLTIAAGETTSTGIVTITANDNNKDEPDKSVTVSGTASGGRGVSDPSSVTLTITDDDDAPSVSINSPSVAEGASGSTATLTYEVTLSAASGKQVTVAYADAGTGTASSADDYTALSSGTLTFAADATSTTIDVTITGDGIDEPDETIIVELSSPINATLGTASGTGTITDDDDKPSVTLSLSPATISETGGVATVAATLSGASSAATTITVSATAGTNAETTDFTLSSDKTLTIAAGVTTSTGTVTISAENNNKDELDKSVTVSGSASGGRGVSDPSNVTLTIADDDDAPSVSINSPSVTEGGVRFDSDVDV